MKKTLLCLGASALLAAPSFAQAPAGTPQDNGLTPQSTTFYANAGANDINNDGPESVGVAIANNGNILLGWEDDGDQLTDLEAVWTLFDSTGHSLIPDTKITTLLAAETVTSKFLSYFRKDGSPIPGYTSWGPKIKANLFGDGLGMGGTSFAIDGEIPEFAPFQNNAAGDNAGDFPTVQLLDNAGKPAGNLSGLSDADAEPDGDVRIGDWDYLSNGNIVVVGESRQKDDLVNRFGGAAPGTHVVFRILDKTGKEIKALTLVSEVPDPSEMWHGVGVTADGFGVRFSSGGRTTVRLFDNTGAPVSDNIDVGSLTGNEITAQGGRGDSAGFHGNGTDSYAVIAVGPNADGIKEVWATVINTNGTIRWSASASAGSDGTNPGVCDVAIAPDGRVVAIWDDLNDTTPKNVYGRLLSASGHLLGGVFYVSEKEVPATATGQSQSPRCTWRNGTLVVAWESSNSGLTDKSVIAARAFTIPPSTVGSPEQSGLTAKSATFYVNPADTINNNSTESLGVAIADNGNVFIGWEDDGDELTDQEGVWTLYDSTGHSLTPATPITSLLGGTFTTKFLSYFRADNSPIPPNTSWGPKIKANLFGDGLGMGSTSFAISDEIPELAPIQNNAGGDNAGDFPTVQLLSDSGQPVKVLSGVTDEDAEPDGDIRIADWDYLSNGNILIVGESRQKNDLVTRFGGNADGVHAVFRIVDKTGKEIKGLTLASEKPEENQMWHGAAVTQNGFGVRFGVGDRTTVRLFDNTGAPITTNIDLGTLTGNEITAHGGRGESVGFHGNGKDAYVAVASGTSIDGVVQIWVTVLNADGTLRWSKNALAGVELNSPGELDASIAPDGRVFVVYDDNAVTSGGARVVQGRVLDANGTPQGPAFYVSELETAATVTGDATGARSFWRGDNIAVVWVSKNSPSPDLDVVAGRILTVGTNHVDGVKLTIARQTGGAISISWDPNAGTLQSTDKLPGGWTPVQNGTNPYHPTSTTGTRFYRVAQ